jgi:hypothetical protein
MKKVYIGKNHEGYVLGVIIADNKDLATAFFMGTEEGLPHSIEEIDLESDHMSTLPVFNLIKSYKMPVWRLKDSRVENVYLCKR